MTVYCPCCGYDTLTAASNYEVCPICFWEDVPTTDIVMRITSNHVTLLQAQRNFLTLGACEADYANLTRPPTETDHRLPDWQPLEEHLRQQQQRVVAPFLYYRHELITLLSPRMSDDLLRYMAMTDYGMNVEQHLAGLRQIRLGEIPTPLHWEPLEVLRLVRWSEPDRAQSHWHPLAYGQSGHLARAFACTALLMATAVPENRTQLHEDDNSTIIQLVASLLTLPEAMQHAGARLLSERLLALDLENDERPFFALGILLLAAALPKPEPTHLAELAAWVLAEEARCRDYLTHFALWQRVTEHWLLGLTTFNLHNEMWQALTVRLLGSVIPSLPPTLATPLQTIVEHIQG